MRKFLFILLLTIIPVCIAYAAEDHSIIIVKQLSIDHRSQLPDKTIEYKLNKLDFNKEKGDIQLIDNISMLIDSISNEDIDNSYYTLSLTEVSPGTVEMSINSLQELPQGVKDKTFYGAIGCCVVMRDGINDGLLKRVFTRSKGKVHLVQEYEIVEEIIKRHPALLNATIIGNEVTIHTLEVNGEEKQLK